MENASKALIIAGAILLSILIIAIGMYIYNSSQNSINSAASQISAQEIQSFNQTWEMYEGTQTGANVRSLISKLSANANTNEEEATRLPDLYVEPTANEAESADSTLLVKSLISSTEGGTNVAGMNQVRSKIESRHEYRVTLLTDPQTSLVSGIMVTYNPDTDVFDGAYDTIISALEATNYDE